MSVFDNIYLKYNLKKGKLKYKNEFSAAKAVIAADGIDGLFFRGLFATLLREVPGYMLYFVAYTVIIRSSLGVSNLQKYT